MKRWAVATSRARLPEGSAALLAGLVLGERIGDARARWTRASAGPASTTSSPSRASTWRCSPPRCSPCWRCAGLPRRGAAVVAAAGAARLRAGRRRAAVRAARHVMGLALLVGLLLDRESQLMNALALAGLPCWPGGPAISASPASSSRSRPPRASSTSGRRSPRASPRAAARAGSRRARRGEPRCAGRGHAGHARRTSTSSR